jgi:methyl-accepting chemotaxis protein
MTDTSATAATAAPAARRRGLFASRSVRSRLFSLVGALLALWLLSVGVAVVGLTQARSGASDIATAFGDANYGFEATSDWYAADGSLSMAVLIAEAKGDPKLIDEAVTNATGFLDSAVQKVTAMKGSKFPELQALADQSLAAMAEYRTFADKTMASIESGDFATANRVQSVDNDAAYSKNADIWASVNTAGDGIVTTIQGEVESAVTRWTTILVVLVVIGFVIGILLTVRIVRSITSPLTKIDEALVRIAEGDLSARVDFDSGDELGRVARSANKAAEAQQTSVAAIADNAQMLAAAAEELTATSNLMSESAEATSNQAVVVAEKNESVNESVQTAATATDQLTASIAQISSSAWDAARVASTAVEVAEATSTIMNKLGASSEDIGKVIKEIKGVADQTNLLALNATIESARAGEAGKGFAVVASEVKDLARATATATTDITTKIQTISDDTSDAINAIAQISETIAQINEIQHSIASAVEEQTAAINEIARSMSEVSSGSSTITSSLEGVSEAAHSASSGAAQTRQAAGELAHMAASLEGLVGAFRY